MEHKQKTFFGRRRGKGMSKAKETLLETYLNKYKIILPQKQNEKINLQDYFDFKPKEFVFEIGYGTGEHLIEMAIKNPDIAFIGTEVFVNGNANIIRQIIEKNIKNIKIFPDDVYLLFPYLKENIFKTIYVLYPDPWPKNRNENRRIINKNNLSLFHKLLADNGNLFIASDHPIYTVWTLFIMQNQNLFKWTATSSKDFVNPPKNWETTHYEQKAIKENRIPIYMNFIKI